MKSRANEIWETLASIIEERGVNDVIKGISSFDARAEDILNRFQDALRLCDAQALSWREKGEKGETAFIALSFLDTGVLTGAHDIRIDFYDERFLHDIAESCAYFSYAHLLPIFRESVEVLCTEAAKQFTRFMDYERDALAWKYKTKILFKMVMSACSLCLMHPGMTEFWPDLSVAENCVFTYGNLLRNHQLLLRLPRKAAAS
ncbi:MAG: hypothetical protein FWH28_08295 [Clostridiales bacterium]|nr:hypothetical protein [Clostridiales bacterium]